MGGPNESVDAKAGHRKKLRAVVRLMHDDRATAVHKWGCSQCKGEEYSEGDKFRKDRNCDGTGRKLYLEYDTSVDRCPWSTMQQEVAFWVNSWMDFERWRVLPYGGSDLMNYPAYFHEAFILCETERTICRNESAEREHKRRNKEEQQNRAKAARRGRH